MPALTVNSVEVAFAYDAAARATPAEQLDSLVDSGYIVLPAGNILPAILPTAHIKTAADMGAAWHGAAGSHGVQYALAEIGGTRHDGILYARVGRRGAREVSGAGTEPGCRSVNSSEETFRRIDDCPLVRYFLPNLLSTKSSH